MISSVNVTEGGALDAETTSDSVIVIYFSKFCCFCCSSVDVLLLYGCQHNSSIGQSSWMSCWLQICYCCLVLFSGMIAYLSPVYEVSPGLHQAFNCPNHTPLHFLNSNFTRYFNVTDSEMMLACMSFLAAKVIENQCS